MSKMNSLPKSGFINRKIMEDLASAIVHREPIKDIKDMFVDSPPYKEAFWEWQQPDTGLNLFQLAIAHDFVAVVRFLSEKQEWHAKVTTDRLSGEIVNSPIHLACKVGAVDCLQFLVNMVDRSRLTVILNSPEVVTYPLQIVNKQEWGVPKTPLRYCMDGKHAYSAAVLCEIIFKEETNRGCILTCDSTPLHKATFLGSVELLQLLLEHGYSRLIDEKNSAGYTALHLSCLMLSAGCMEVLLRHGTSVKISVNCSSPLHLMYGSRIKQGRLLPCTQELVRYGVRLNEMDHNHNTALDYLTWIYAHTSQSYNCRCLSTVPHPQSHRSYISPESGTQELPDVSQEELREDILQTMMVLLNAGAHTVVRVPDFGILAPGDVDKPPLRVDHTIVQTLLQNTGWPLSNFLVRYPEDVLRALDVLFYHGADPNVLARNNNQSAFTTLIMHSLHEVRTVEHKCRFVHLFIQSGADLENPIPQPMNFRETYGDKLWNIYSVLLALQERHPILVVGLMFSYMSLSQVHVSFQMVAESYIWQRMQRIVHRAPTSPGVIDYKRQWQRLKRQMLLVRTLRHCCKLVVLKSMKRKTRFVPQLPLPNALKDYLIAQCV